MTPEVPINALRLHLSVGLLSVALIAFQLVLMQVLSVVQWYHFAYMVISVALLGFGASGTLLALARTWMLERFEVLVPLLMIASGAAIAVVVALSQTPVARFDAYLLFVERSQLGALLLTYLLFFVPFFLGALAIGLVFVRHTDEIGSYYFANLIGSGLGGLLAIVLLWKAVPERLPAAVALVAVAAGLLILPRRRVVVGLAAIAALGLSVAFLLYPPSLERSEYKSLSRTLTLPEAEIVLERSSPYGLVQVVASPALRYAPGLSLAFQGEIPVQQAVFNNGNWFGPVTSWSRQDTTHLLDYATDVLPYAMRPRAAVLVLNAGTGEHAAHAATRGAARIVAVEPHAEVVDLLRGELAEATDSLVYHPAVTVHQREPRTYLAADTARYDLIALPTLGAFGGTIGLSALQEQYTLTKAAFQAMWERLAPDGVVSVTVWMDYPYRYPLKVLATLVEVLDEVGIEDPTAHLAAVRSWGTMTFVLKRSALTPQEIRQVRAVAADLSFDPALLPGLDPGERTRFNQLQDDRFFTYVDRLLSSERDELYEAYDFAIAPATDNRPYFSQFLRWGSLPHLADQFGGQTFPFLEVGYLIVGVTLVQILLAAFLLILLPLFRVGWRGRGKTWTLLYFGGLGLGFLFVEIVLIQRFILYLGHPLYATAAVLTTLLVSSGVGSYVSARLPAQTATLRRVAGTVAVLLLLYTLVLMPLLEATITLPLGLKALGTFLLIAPPAFVMGVPFPLGLRYLSRRSDVQVPWAWGINGCLSVVSTVLATLVAVEGGFVLVMLLAAGAYGGVALISVRRLSPP